MKKLWNIICSLFTRENIGIIWKTLFASAKDAAKKAINDPKVQAKAFETAKTLLSMDISGDAKKDAFNSAMKDFFAEYGAEVGTSTLNCIRELAVEAVKQNSEEAAGTGTVAKAVCITVLCFASVVACVAEAGTQVIEMKPDGRTYRLAGRMTGWEAFSTNLTATLTVTKCLDLYAESVQSVPVVSYAPKTDVSYTPLVITNCYTNVVVNPAYTVFTNGSFVVIGSTTNSTVVTDVATNYIEKVSKSYYPVTNYVDKVQNVFVSQVTNQLFNTTLVNGYKSGDEAANIAPSEYLKITGSITNDPNAKIVIFMGQEAATGVITE